MSNEILSEIRLVLDGYRKDLKTAQDEGAAAGGKAGKDFGDGIEKNLNSAFSGIKSKLLGLAAAIGGAFTLKESIAAASEQEHAIQSLNSALALSGQYSEQVSNHFLDMAASLQKTTTAADETIVQGAALIQTMGQLSGPVLERATAAALDMAAALNIDVDTAFRKVGAAASGHVASLAKYGIQVKATGNDALDFSRALEQMETRFKGLAALQTNTFDGALKQTKNQFGEVLESIGNIIIKSPTMIRMLQSSARAFETMAESIANFAKGRDIIHEILQGAIDLGQGFTTYLVLPLELGFNILNLGFETLKFIFQGFIVAVASGFGLITSILAPLGGKFAEVNTGLQSFVESSKATLADFGDKVVAANDQLFNFDAAAKSEEYLAKLQEFSDTVTPVVASNFAGLAETARLAMVPSFTQGWDFIVNGFNQAFSRVSLTSDKFKADLQNKLNTAFASFRDGVATSFASIGAALVKGENAFAAFGKALLGVFGDLAIQVGTFYFLLGLGNLFLNPAAAAAQIGAGLALIVLGGALKAVAGGGGGAPATSAGGAGGGGAAGGATGTAPATNDVVAFKETKPQEPQTKIELHIQGNVLDRRATGLELVDVLNEAFGSNGLVTQS